MVMPRRCASAGGSTACGKRVVQRVVQVACKMESRPLALWSVGAVYGSWGARMAHERVRQGQGHRSF